MANTITKQTIVDSERNLVVKVTIAGDNSGDESATLLIDLSDYAPSEREGAPTSVKLMRVIGSLDGFTATLEWDADSNVDAWTIPADASHVDFGLFGGLVNNAGIGVTGDIAISTNGLGSENGSFVLEMVKRYSDIG